MIFYPRRLQFSEFDDTILIFENERERDRDRDSLFRCVRRNAARLVREALETSGELMPFVADEGCSLLINKETLMAGTFEFQPNAK